MSTDFNSVYIRNERLDGYHIEDTNWSKEGICKRCGKEFKKKYPKQIFCSRRCISKYRTGMKAMIDKHGSKFLDWLNDEIDYEYSPEKF